MALARAPQSRGVRERGAARVSTLRMARSSVVALALWLVAMPVMAATIQGRVGQLFVYANAYH